MRNFDVLATGCTVTTESNIVDVGDTRGIVIGMSVKEYDNTDVNEPPIATVYYRLRSST